MRHFRNHDSGVALIAVLMVLLILTTMMLGFYFVTTGEQRVAASDRDNTVAYYGAVGGLEKMSSDLAAFFVSHTSPTPSQIDALTGSSYVPSILGISYPPGGYIIQYTTATNGKLASTSGTIQGNGPLQGLQGVITPFTLTVTASGPNNTEVKMTRVVQEVAVPVFQFGIFSETDLSFFAGPDFNFGGRVATNGNLFLAENGGTLTIDDRATAYQDVIRAQLSNGFVNGTGGQYNTAVDVLTTAGGCPGAVAACRPLALTEGSLIGGPGSAPNPNWTTLSVTTYNGWILNQLTGAKKLNLALALAGASPVALIQRAPTGEDPTGTTGSARFFNQASLRILLSDTQAAIMSLPGIDTTKQPYPLAEAGSTGMPIAVQRTNNGGSYYLPPTDSCHPPIAESPGFAADNDYMFKPGTTLLGGYIKIEMQLNATPGTWQDVTQEILSLGISHDIQSTGVMTPVGCTNQAILHLEDAKPIPPEGAPALATASNGGLNANTTYFYVVTALGPWGESTGTEASKTTTNNRLTIDLTWNAYPGATGYNIYRGTAAGGENGPITVASNPTSYTDAGAVFPAGQVPTNILTTLAATQTATNFVPINLYDPREGEVRDNAGPNTLTFLGVMNLVEIDVRNLQQWFAGAIGASGTLALNNSGYIVYVSDRRGNNDGSGNETGEFGYEDTINPPVANGVPNGVLDAPEDVDGDGVFRTYGAHPYYLGDDLLTDPAGLFDASPLKGSIQGLTPMNAAIARVLTPFQGQKNPVVLFRRAVRLEHGTLGNLPPLAAAACTLNASGGFTLAAENPVYIEGDYNASVFNQFNDAAGQCHVPSAVIGDAVTLLSNNWKDSVGIANPTNLGGRAATTTWYRTAVVGGKNLSFPQPAWGAQDSGTDGGVHNFLRYIENWGGQQLNYRGSLVSFYIARQATGIYKCCTVVYSPPSRGYNFDTDFQSIATLPPGTPRFTDVNALSYQQAILPSQ
jgi:Tfp pilus assembly protein PilX